MDSDEKKRVRVFPFRPKPEPSSMVDFIEETGTNAFLIEAVKKLYEVPKKPENPIEWLRLYFKHLAPDRIKEMKETEEILKFELMEIETELINTHEEEADYQEILDKLEHEYRNSPLYIGNKQDPIENDNEDDEDEPAPIEFSPINSEEHMSSSSTIELEEEE